MSKLNPSRSKSRPATAQAVAVKHNLELGVSANGNVQFKKEPAQMLYEVVTTSLFGRDGQLKSNAQLLKDLEANLRRVVDAGMYDFIANLAIHARTEMHIRTMPIVMVVQFAKLLADRREPVMNEIKAVQAAMRDQPQLLARFNSLREMADSLNYPNMRRLVCDVIQRADQINDMYAYALEVFGNKKNIPMAIRRGVADACNKFNEYHFGKYNRAGTVSFRDVLRIVHPVATDAKQGAIFAKIMSDSLATPYTWETELSINGQRPAGEQLSKKDLWTQLLSSRKVGYMALLRNMRNVVEAGVDSNIVREFLCDVIADPAQVARSKQLPFDLLEAYRVVAELDGKLATATSKAIDLSVQNIPEIGKRVWLIADYSGSMGNHAVDTSAISTSTMLLAALLKASEGADNVAVTLFGSGAKTLRSIDTNQSVLSLRKELLSHRTGQIAGSTNYEAGIRELSNIGFTPDTIIVLTDGEVNGFKYRTMNTLPAAAFKLTINMSSATTTPMVKENGWMTLSGWSPAMFKWIPAMRSKDTVVELLAGPYKGLTTSEDDFEA